MTCSSLFHFFMTAALAVSVVLPAGAQSVVGKDRTGPVPNPVNLDTTGLFQAKFVSVGDDMFIGGQPTEKALRELRARDFSRKAFSKNLREPLRRHRRPSVRAEATRHVRGGDGGGGRQGPPALHHRLASESPLGRLPHS